MLRHVSRSGNSSWEGSACADISIKMDIDKEGHVEDGDDDYKTETFLQDYDDGNSSTLLQLFNQTNISFLEEIINVAEILNEDEISDAESVTDIIPMAEPYIQQYNDEDNKTEKIEAEHRQMDIKLDEITLLQNPDVDIFPMLERTSLVTTNTAKQLKTSTTTKKPNEQKPKSSSFGLRISFLLIFVLLSILGKM